MSGARCACSEVGGSASHRGHNLPQVFETNDQFLSVTKEVAGLNGITIRDAKSCESKRCVTPAFALFHTEK